MKNILLLSFLLLGLLSYSQTTTDLLGKWKLIKWTENEKEKDLKAYFKTDQVYQIFSENGVFESIIGNETHKGKWKLSKDLKTLTITTTLIPVKFEILFFDAQKRIMHYETLGTFEYLKITEK